MPTFSSRSIRSANPRNESAKRCSLTVDDPWWAEVPVCVWNSKQNKENDISATSWLSPTVLSRFSCVVVVLSTLAGTTSVCVGIGTPLSEMLFRRNTKFDCFQRYKMSGNYLSEFHVDSNWTTAFCFSVNNGTSMSKETIFFFVVDSVVFQDRVYYFLTRLKQVNSSIQYCFEFRLPLATSQLKVCQKCAP